MDQEPRVTARQFLEAHRKVTEGWSSDDPRYEDLFILLEYSVQYGMFQSSRQKHY